MKLLCTNLIGPTLQAERIQLQNGTATTATEASAKNRNDI